MAWPDGVLGWAHMGFRSRSFGCPRERFSADPSPAERTRRSAPPPPWCRPLSDDVLGGAHIGGFRSRFFGCPAARFSYDPNPTERTRRSARPGAERVERPFRPHPALTPPSPAVTWALLTGRRFAGEGGSARRGRGLAADWIYQPTRGLWDLVQGVAGNSISVRRSILRTATTRLAPRRAVAPRPFHEHADKPVSGSAGLRSGN